MASGRKIADAATKCRSSTPFFAWIRDKLLAVNRQGNNPPGIPTSAGKFEFNNPLKFSNTQSERDQPDPSLPGGVHHKLADNFYFERDGRRALQPPKPVYSSEMPNKSIDSGSGKTEVREAVSGNKNFGLEAPIPGLGLKWDRNKDQEMETQRNSSELTDLERYDRFTHTN